MDLKSLTKIIDKAEHIFYDALENASIGIWEWDIKKDYLFWDHRMFKLFDVDPETFKHTYKDFSDCVHPKDMPTVQKAVDHTLDTGAPYEYSFRVKTKNGKWRKIIGKGSRVIENGEVTKLSGVCFLLKE